MAIKTISLELDAYEKLKRAKRGSESFSAVVRRARFDAGASTGSSILEETAAHYHSGRGCTRKTLDYWDTVAREEATVPRVTPSQWIDNEA